jgi:hypothetical protein
MRRSNVFELRQSELVFFIGIHEQVIPYKDIISIEKSNVFRVLLRSINPFKRPLFTLPLGVSLICVRIETNRKSMAVMLNRCDDFIAELKTALHGAQVIETGSLH